MRQKSAALPRGRDERASPAGMLRHDTWESRRNNGATRFKPWCARRNLEPRKQPTTDNAAKPPFNAPAPHPITFPTAGPVRS
jgi:hypothetical protein